MRTSSFRYSDCPRYSETGPRIAINFAGDNETMLISAYFACGRSIRSTASTDRLSRHPKLKAHREQQIIRRLFYSRMT